MLLVAAGAFVAFSTAGNGGGAATSSRTDTRGGSEGQVASTDEGEASEETASTKPVAATTQPPAPVISAAPAPTGSALSGSALPGVVDGDRLWVAMRASLGDEASASGLAQGIDGAFIFRSEEYASLTPGYWVVAAGVYETSDAALGYCRDNALYAASDCVAAPLSQLTSDRTIRLSLE